MNLKVLITGGIGDNIINIICAYYYLKKAQIDNYEFIISETIRYKIDIIIKCLDPIKFNKSKISEIPAEVHKNILNAFLAEQESAIFGPKTLVWENDLYLCFWPGLSKDISKLLSLSNSWVNLNETYCNLQDDSPCNYFFKKHLAYPNVKNIFLTLVANSINYNPINVLNECIDYITNTFIDCDSLNILIPNDKREDLDKSLTLDNYIIETISKTVPNNIRTTFIDGDFNEIFNFLKKSDFIIGARSGLFELAYLINKPSMILYPEYQDYVFYRLSENEPIFKQTENFVISTNYL